MNALIAFLGTFVVSYAGTAAILRLPVARRIVDVPNERSSHETPKPRLGGVAIFAAFVAGMAFLAVRVPATRGFLPLVAGGALLFAAGLADDWRGLGVGVRFAVQLAAAAIAVAAGAVVDHVTLPFVGTVALGWLSVPATVLFVLASINFYNFIDGIDGLAAGSAFLASGFLALIAMILGHAALGLVFLVIGGSALGFLQFNFPPSRLFMGDGGSTLLGYAFAYTAAVGNARVPELPVFIPLLILSSLYIDAGLTLSVRMVRGEKIFRPHHTHYYQRLLSLGLNHKQVTLLEYAFVVLLGVSAVLYFKASTYFMLFLTLSWFVIFAGAILKIRSLERGDRLFWEKRGLLVIATDVVLITAAYVGAYFLRMNFEFTHAEGTAMLRALPIVLVVRTAVFFKYGLYRTVWKYTSVSDIVRVIKAVTTGSVIILTAVVLLYRFVAFPRTLFIIEYFLLIVFILGARFAYRLFYEIGREPQGDGVKRYAVVGAGDLGERIAREVRGHDGRRGAVACFVDDDPGKRGLMLHGVPIAGPIDRLGDLCREHEVDAVIVGISRLDERRVADVVRLARDAGVPIEGRPGAGDGGEPAGVVFERLGRSLGRRPFPTPDGTEAALRRRRVLVTHGGDGTGTALVRDLLRMGASVTVQKGSARERPDATGVLDDAIVYLGGLADDGSAAALVAQSAPDVVFHCVSLDIRADANTDAFLWDDVVSGTERLVAALEDRPDARVVLVSHWGGAEPRSGAAIAGAAAEVILLTSGRRSAVLRLPRVLTGGALGALLRPPAGAPRRVGFDLLEDEAVACALTLAVSGDSGCFVPTWWGAITGDQVLAAAGRPLPERSGAQATPQTRSGPPRFGPVFPAERVEDAGSAQLRKVSGPALPAVLAGREQWIEAASSELLEIVPSGLRYRAGARRPS